MSEGVVQPPWPMGAVEWLELAAFWLAACAMLAVLVLPWRRERVPATRRGFGATRWRAWPELRLLLLALPLELLWEIAQLPLYDIWYQNDWGYIFYGVAHCTAGDLLILLVLYELVALLSRDRRWYRRVPGRGGLAFTLLGVGYTVFSEINHVRIKGTWGYADLMPIVPLVEIGAAPFLQWVLIPPVLVWLMRTMPTRADTPGTSR